MISEQVTSQAGPVKKDGRRRESTKAGCLFAVPPRATPAMLAVTLFLRDVRVSSFVHVVY